MAKCDMDPLMMVGFDQFELDGDKFELRKDGTIVPVEPQVLALLLLLVSNRHRLVSKDDLIEHIWQGRIVSESAISSRLKSARKALGDSGEDQRLIRTIHGKGYRFVGDVCGPDRVPPQAQVVHHTEVQAGPVSGCSRPSIAVLPFVVLGDAGPHALVAEALPHELIAELARLRWLFVTSRGSSFRFRSPHIDIQDVGGRLGVRYCLTGTLEAEGDALGINVELVDARDGGVMWGERYSSPLAGIFELRSKIVAETAAALELQIPAHEARAARLSSPENLDAWGLYHLALQHMFRFDKRENMAAAAMFERAIAEEPGFARAHAGLSFTHFQSSFLNYGEEPAKDAMAARCSAERALEIDSLDPFANFTFGRSLWLDGDVTGSLAWLDRAITLSPNYAQGIYARAWAETVLCRGDEGQQDADLAMVLSPLDPFHYAMLGTRALSHFVRGEDEAAADWAERAARAPGAHVLISVIAAACHSAAQNPAKAQFWVERVRAHSPGDAQANFFRSFPFEDEGVRTRLAASLSAAGL
jgi:TolB-like protein